MAQVNPSSPCSSVIESVTTPTDNARWRNMKGITRSVRPLIKLNPLAGIITVTTINGEPQAQSALQLGYVFWTQVAILLWQCDSTGIKRNGTACLDWLHC